MLRFIRRKKIRSYLFVIIRLISLASTFSIKPVTGAVHPVDHPPFATAAKLVDEARDGWWKYSKDCAGNPPLLNIQNPDVQRHSTLFACRLLEKDMYSGSGIGRCIIEGKELPYWSTFIKFARLYGEHDKGGDLPSFIAKAQAEHVIQNELYQSDVGELEWPFWFGNYDEKFQFAPTPPPDPQWEINIGLDFIVMNIGYSIADVRRSLHPEVSHFGFGMAFNEEYIMIALLFFMRHDAMFDGSTKIHYPYLFPLAENEENLRKPELIEVARELTVRHLAQAISSQLNIVPEPLTQTVNYPMTPTLFEEPRDILYAVGSTYFCAYAIVLSESETVQPDEVAHTFCEEVEKQTRESNIIPIEKLSLPKFLPTPWLEQILDFNEIFQLDEKQRSKIVVASHYDGNNLTLVHTWFTEATLTYPEVGEAYCQARLAAQLRPWWPNMIQNIECNMMASECIGKLWETKASGSTCSGDYTISFQYIEVSEDDKECVNFSPGHALATLINEISCASLLDSTFNSISELKSSLATTPDTDIPFRLLPDKGKRHYAERLQLESKYGKPIGAATKIEKLKMLIVIVFQGAIRPRQGHEGVLRKNSTLVDALGLPSTTNAKKEDGNPTDFSRLMDSVVAEMVAKGVDQFQKQWSLKADWNQVATDLAKVLQELKVYTGSGIGFSTKFNSDYSATILTFQSLDIDGAFQARGICPKRVTKQAVEVAIETLCRDGFALTDNKFKVKYVGSNCDSDNLEKTSLPLQTPSLKALPNNFVVKYQEIFPKDYDELVDEADGEIAIGAYVDPSSLIATSATEKNLTGGPVTLNEIGMTLARKLSETECSAGFGVGTGFSGGYYQLELDGNVLQQVLDKLPGNLEAQADFAIGNQTIDNFTPEFTWPNEHETKRRKTFTLMSHNPNCELYQLKSGPIGAIGIGYAELKRKKGVYVITTVAFTNLAIDVTNALAKFNLVRDGFKLFASDSPEASAINLLATQYNTKVSNSLKTHVSEMIFGFGYDFGAFVKTVDLTISASTVSAEMDLFAQDILQREARTGGVKSQALYPNLQHQDEVRGTFNFEMLDPSDTVITVWRNQSNSDTISPRLGEPSTKAVGFSAITKNISEGDGNSKPYAILMVMMYSPSPHANICNDSLRPFNALLPPNKALTRQMLSPALNTIAHTLNTSSTTSKAKTAAGTKAKFMVGPNFTAITCELELNPKPDVDSQVKLFYTKLFSDCKICPKDYITTDLQPDLKGIMDPKGESASPTDYPVLTSTTSGCIELLHIFANDITTIGLDVKTVEISGKQRHRTTLVVQTKRIAYSNEVLLGLNKIRKTNGARRFDRQSKLAAALDLVATSATKMVSKKRFNFLHAVGRGSDMLIFLSKISKISPQPTAADPATRVALVNNLIQTQITEWCALPLASVSDIYDFNESTEKLVLEPKDAPVSTDVSTWRNGPTKEDMMIVRSSTALVEMGLALEQVNGELVFAAVFYCPTPYDLDDTLVKTIQDDRSKFPVVHVERRKLISAPFNCLARQFAKDILTENLSQGIARCGHIAGVFKRVKISMFQRDLEQGYLDGLMKSFVTDLFSKEDSTRTKEKPRFKSPVPIKHGPFFVWDVKHTKGLGHYLEITLEQTYAIGLSSAIASTSGYSNEVDLMLVLLYNWILPLPNNNQLAAHQSPVGHQPLVDKLHLNWVAYSVGNALPLTSFPFTGVKMIVRRNLAAIIKPIRMKKDDIIRLFKSHDACKNLVQTSRLDVAEQMLKELHKPERVSVPFPFRNTNTGDIAILKGMRPETLMIYEHITKCWANGTLYGTALVRIDEGTLVFVLVSFFGFVPKDSTRLFERFNNARPSYAPMKFKTLPAALLDVTAWQLGQELLGVGKTMGNRVVEDGEYFGVNDDFMIFSNIKTSPAGDRIGVEETTKFLDRLLKLSQEGSALRTRPPRFEPIKGVDLKTFSRPLPLAKFSSWYTYQLLAPTTKVISVGVAKHNGRLAVVVLIQLYNPFRFDVDKSNKYLQGGNAMFQLNTVASLLADKLIDKDSTGAGIGPYCEVLFRLTPSFIVKKVGCKFEPLLEQLNSGNKWYVERSEEENIDGQIFNWGERKRRQDHSGGGNSEGVEVEEFLPISSRSDMKLETDRIKYLNLNPKNGYGVANVRWLNGAMLTIVVCQLPEANRNTIAAEVNPVGITSIIQEEDNISFFSRAVPSNVPNTVRNLLIFVAYEILKYQQGNECTFDHAVVTVPNDSKTFQKTAGSVTPFCPEANSILDLEHLVTLCRNNTTAQQQQQLENEADEEWTVFWVDTPDVGYAVALSADWKKVIVTITVHNEDDSKMSWDECFTVMPKEIITNHDLKSKSI